MGKIDELHGRIADLETEVRILKDDKKQLRDELDEAHEAVTNMREHVESANDLIERWVESFDMVQDENGNYTIAEWINDLCSSHEALQEAHAKMVREWNKFVPLYNDIVAPRAPKRIGRPLLASESQRQDVLRLRSEGKSLRGIVKEIPSLTLTTVRTILDQGTDKERTRTGELRRETFDRMAAAKFKAGQRSRDYLQKRINANLKSGADLVKAAKGLGKAAR